MAKTEVYSWRLDPALKGDLEEAARRREVSVAELLEGIAEDWLTRDLSGRQQEEEEQKRLRQKASSFIGSFDGGDPQRASEAKERIRRHLRERRPGAS